MTENTVSISTRQASELLGVHESSVKRWCNAEELAYWSTPGGHRRIPIAALVEFARGQSIEVPLRHFGRDAARVWTGLEKARRDDDFAALVDLAYDWITQGWSSLPARLIEYLSDEGFSLGRTLDQLVGPLMARIGRGYLKGTLSIGDEHLMTQAVRDVLVTLSASGSPSGRTNGTVKPVAVVGCARGEVHELGALMVRLVLEAAGWRVVYLGLNVPTEEFAMQQTKHAAALVCISMMPPMGLTEAQTMVDLLDRIYDGAHPYRLALGGSALRDDDALNRTGLSIPEVRLFSNMEPFEAWVRASANKIASAA